MWVLFFSFFVYSNNTCLPTVHQFYQTSSVFCSNIIPCCNIFFSWLKWKRFLLQKWVGKIVSLHWKYVPPFNRMFPNLYGHCINNTLHRGSLVLRRWCKAAASWLYSWNSLMPPCKRETWRGKTWIGPCIVCIGTILSYPVSHYYASWIFFIVIDM